MYVDVIILTFNLLSSVTDFKFECLLSMFNCCLFLDIKYKKQVQGKCYFLISKVSSLHLVSGGKKIKRFKTDKIKQKSAMHHAKE